MNKEIEKLIIEKGNLELNGKKEIEDIIKSDLSEAHKVSKLKNFYGLGGYNQNEISCIFDSKGMRFTIEGERINVKWKEVFQIWKKYFNN